VLVSLGNTSNRRQETVIITSATAPSLTPRDLDQLADAVVSILSEDLEDLHLTIHSGNGKALAYLAAHAEIYHQETVEDNIVVDCRLPKVLLPRLEGMGVGERSGDSTAKRKGIGFDGSL
jgi:50S ribosomal subunit-associated GTPase HflX